ncbi:hypothetical protein [Streptomyces sp. C8S0]|uniref:hypothetical protein n=1 Tax=Streptomyces sp. C8S0 TaxID=2585716 RepID=UPI001D0415D0|nr:hypothetical protein [Streptomyces sp. C8S0]
MTGFVPGGLVARLAAHAHDSAEKPALSIASLGGGPRVDQTYGQLWGRSLAVARALNEKVRPGSRVLLLFPTAPEFAPPSSAALPRASSPCPCRCHSTREPDAAC